MKGPGAAQQNADAQIPVLYPDVQKGFERIGGTNVDRRARWLLRFAQSDFGSLSRGDWLNLWSELLAFARLRQSAFPFTTFTPSVQTAANWRAVIRTGLREMKEGRAWRVATGPQVYELSRSERGLAAAHIVWQAEHLYEHLKDAFLEEVVWTLERVGERFRFCLRCGEAFIARKRQAYCTPRCSQTSRTNKYRKAYSERVRAPRENTARRRASGRKRKTL